MATITEVIGAMSPVQPAAATAIVKSPSTSGDTKLVTHVLLPAVAAAALGAFFCKKHRILGAIGGAAIGGGAYPISQGGDARSTAFWRLGAVGAGTLLALRARKPMKSALWYGAGAGAVVAGNYAIGHKSLFW